MGNCPTARYGEGVSWNIRAGHGCVGCVMPDFWDQMGPAYKRLPAPIPFLPNVTTDMVGAAAVGAVGAVVVAHSVGMGIRFKRRARIARREALAAAEGVAVAEAVDVLPLDGEPDAEPADDGPAADHAPEEPAADHAADPVAAEADAPAGTEER
jgi:hydrogenase small subunit